MRAKRAAMFGVAAAAVCGALFAFAPAIGAPAASDNPPLPIVKRPPPPPRPGPAWGGYPFPRELDAEIADGDVHRVLYEDKNVMFLEVANPPGLDIHMHGHPFASVFGHDSSTGGPNPEAPPKPPGGYQTKYDPDSAFNGQGWQDSAPPKGAQWPTCTTAPPQAPHRPFNANLNPNHFYRLEFLHLDGDDFKTHWKEWYPQASEPIKPLPDPVANGEKFSTAWPFPIAYDEIKAAPNNYRLLYEDGKMRLVEVTIRAGETTPMHGHPYASVIAYDTVTKPGDVSETFLDSKSAQNGQTTMSAKAPTVFNMTVPLCSASAPQAPHKIANRGALPIHYYRFEYKRIDGDALKTHWQEWYPWMKYLPYMR